MLFEAKYKHWEGRHRSIWYRRAVIAAYGLRDALRIKWMRLFVTLAWIMALIQTAILFAVGQLLVEDSIIFLLLNQMGPQIRAFADALLTWIVDHPEISIRTSYTVMFYFFATQTIFPGLIAVGLALPNTISRDLSSKAILVYSAKALSRTDYLLGKFSVLFGLLTLTWLGPLVCAWFFGNLMAPDWHFFWHSRIAVFRLLVYVGTSVAIISLLGLGVSSLSKKPASTFGIWLVFWIVPSVFLVPLSMVTKPWLQYFSFTHNLDLLARKFFALHEELELARDNIPVLGPMLENLVPQDSLFWQNPDIQQALWGLGIMATLAAWSLFRRCRPE